MAVNQTIDPPWQPFLACAGVAILDGGMASELEHRGADLGDPLWSARLLLEGPDQIRQVHQDYFAAGADVVISASYQASLPGLEQRGLTRPQAEDVLRQSVRLAQEARTRFWQGKPADRMYPLVAASVGPYGASRHDGSEYRGDYGRSVKQLMDWHRPRLEVLATSGADLLACETIPCLAEAEALVRLLDEGPPIAAWLSFSCRDARHTCHGEALREAIACAAECVRVGAIGVNCTAPAYVEELLHVAATVTNKPLVAYPNAGERWDAERRTWDANPDAIEWGQAARSWYVAGARLIGGCCRTTPATVRAIRQALVGGGPGTAGTRAG